MEIQARIVRLELAETFVIARDAADYADVVHVGLRHKGATGYGEAAPVDRYAESAESAVKFVEENGELVGDDPFALEEIGERLAPCPVNRPRRRRSTARSTISRGSCSESPHIACSVCPRHGPPTSWTVWLGDPDDMARRAEKAAPASGG